VGDFHSSLLSVHSKNLTPYFPLSLKKEEGRDRNGAWITGGGKFLSIIVHFKNLTPFFPLSLKKEEGRDRNVA
jgi:hypothetical protein